MHTHSSHGAVFSYYYSTRRYDERFLRARPRSARQMGGNPGGTISPGLPTRGVERRYRLKIRMKRLACDSRCSDRRGTEVLGYPCTPPGGERNENGTQRAYHE